MKSESRFGRSITEEVRSWFGVTVTIGRRGETLFMVNRRKIGCLYGDSVALFRFDPALRTQLLLAGRVADHPLYPRGSGPAVRRMISETDARDVVRLMWVNYENAIARFNRRAERAAIPVFAERMVAN